MDRSNRIDEIAEFFEGDGRAEMFVNANYRGTDYTRSVLDSVTIEDPKKCGLASIWYLMMNGQETFVHDNIIDFVIQSALFHRKLDQLGGIDTRNPDIKLTLDVNNTGKSNDQMARIIDIVYNRWNTLSNEARAFYRQHMLLFEQTSSGEWIALETPENRRAPNSNLRLNLLKAPNADGTPDKTRTVFGASLPRVKKGFTTVYGGFRDANGLEDLYHVVLRTGGAGSVLETVSASASAITITPENRATKEKKKFNLNTQVYVTGVINCLKDSKSVVGSDVEKILSMYDGQLYSRDSYGRLLRKDKEGKLAEVKYEDATCGGLVLGEKTPAGECVEVISCLLDSSRDLDTCLNTLRNRNMFDVAQEELKKVHPSVALKLFEKFGVRLVESDLKAGRGKVPQTFESWKNSVPLADSVKSVLFSNTQLMDYLRGVISIFRQNPLALDSNTGLNTAFTLPEHLRGTKMSVTQNFIDPKVALEIEAENMRKLKLQPVPKFDMGNMPFPLPNNLLAVVMAMQSYGNVQSGGSLNGSLTTVKNNSDNLETEFNVLKRKLEEYNRPLDEQSVKGIEDVIVHLKKYEKQLVQMLAYLNVFTDANEIIKLNGGNDRVVPSNLQEVAYVAQDPNGYLNDVIRELKGCIDKNLATQHKIVVQLGGEVYPALIDVLNGKKNSIITK